MENSKTRENIRALVECAVLIALAYVLNMFKLWRMPQGGSVHPASMLPLVFIGLRHGPKWGFFGCTVYGILDFLLDGGFSLHIASIFLDYVLAYGAMGVAGFFKDKKWGIWAAMPVAVAARFVFLFLSGVTVWSVYAPDPAFWSVVKYSAGYNGTFLAVELGLMFALAIALIPTFRWILPEKKA